MGHTTAELRELWKFYECKPERMEVVAFGPDNIRVAPPTTEAWQALEAVFEHHGYVIRRPDTDSYSCRPITDGTGKSLHAYGIVVDVNWDTNPWIDHPGTRTVKYSTKRTQDERARDVARRVADTDMTAAMIADVKAIKTAAGEAVFRWGGDFKSVKDAMHFEIMLSPDELGEGVDFSTVAGWAAAPGRIDRHAVPNAAPAPAPVAALPEREAFVVTARSGLNLRAGPSTEFDVLRLLPRDSRLFVVGREGSWAQVDLQGDGYADGFVSQSFLRQATPAPATPDRSSTPDVTDRITATLIKPMFPVTPLSNISANLGFVLEALSDDGIGDRLMVLMALATIRAETEGFVPIPEGRSRYNTRNAPFDLYEGRADLGNTVRGDGLLFRGRGYVQLTGRHNYAVIGAQLSLDLVGRPDLALEPATAGRILSRFLYNKQDAIRAALRSNRLRVARRLVNGGSHGYERFRDAYEAGATLI